MGMKNHIGMRTLLLLLLLVAPGMMGLCVEPLAVAPDGGMTYDAVRMRLAWFDGEWRMTGQEIGTVSPSSGYPIQNAQIFELDGALKLFHDAGEVALSETVSLAENQFTYHAELRGGAMPCRNAVLILELPIENFGGRVITVDDTKITLAAEKKDVEYPVLFHRNAMTVPLPSGDWVISGDLSVTIQDERNYGGNFYSVRILGAQKDSTLQNYSWDLQFSNVNTGVKADATKKVLTIEPIDISRNANMSWRDEVPGDHKGGWSDQGDNDVRDIVPGRQVFSGVLFDLIDPAKNQDKSCMIFAGPDRDYMLPSTRIEQIQKQGEMLYFFHGLSWAPETEELVATVKVIYTDGSSQILEVKSNRDVCNWWYRMRSSNALIAWRGRNPQSETTLYLSGFPIDGTKTVEALELVPTKCGVWMVGALSIGDRVPALEPMVRNEIVADADHYRALALGSELEVEAGSALDFSGMNHKPAGKYGWVKAVGETFEFENRPGVPERFYGVNICWSSNSLSKEQSEILAARLERLGYNTVRLHHYDMMMTERIENRPELDPEIIDRMDYLVYQLKEHGIYVTFDLYTYRIPAEADVGVRVKDLHDFRAALPVVERVNDNFKAFAKSLLTHKNPYTGLEWRNDPAIFAICTVNENLLPAPWKNHPQLPAIYREKFNQWCANRNITPPESFDDSLEFQQFILELQQKVYEDHSTFLHDLGVKAILTDNNCGASFSQTVERSMLDYVDLHTYWEHPIGIEKPWELPHYYPQLSAVAEKAQVPRTMMPARVIGKPLMVTELNYLFPNHYRSEGGLLTGAYASFQNWSGIYRFTYAEVRDSMFEPRSIYMFDTVHDPIQLLTDRLGGWLFRSFAVQEGRNLIPMIFTKEDYPGYAEYSKDFSLVGLLTRIGSLDASRNPLNTEWEVALANPKVTNVPGVKELLQVNGTLTDELARRGMVNAVENGVYMSDTGEIKLDSVRGTLQVETPSAVAAVLPDGETMTMNELQVTQNSGFATIALLPRTGTTLRNAERLLLLHLTDVMNNKITFRDGANTILESYGELPLLARRGQAEVSLRKGNEQSLSVYALSIGGRRQVEIPVRDAGLYWNLSLDTFCAEEPVFAYELVRN